MAKHSCLVGALGVAVSVLFLHGAHAAIDAADAVGVWLFDDGAGDTAVDLSGLGNDGPRLNATWTDDGAFGKALEFNGSDACVETGQPLLDGLSDFTITAWVKPIDMAGNRIGLVGQNDSPEFGFIDAGTINLWTPNGAASIPYGHDQDQWHFVAGVASPDKTAVYVDTDEVTSGGAPDRGTSAFTVNIGGCGIWDAAGNWFSGQMDDVSIWHVALEPEDLEVLMTQGLGGALGLLPVSAKGKVTATWAGMKRHR
ncbi:hypothetical protein CMK11_11245 [Candidatus Poribacteria bacterium]|nr:hypothetical protein [Candidatus Poribacteria bacterium]